MICPMGCECECISLPRNNYECPKCKGWFKDEGKAPIPSEKPKKEVYHGNSWGFVEEEMQKNSTVRVNWKFIFGMSLTRLVAKLKTQGLNADEAYISIVSGNNALSEELKRRLKIGVAARYGEMATVESEKEKVRS
jgi:hypothetical protein